MNGIGKLKLKDDKLYIGEFSDDKKHGYGIYTWENKKYLGYWKNDKQHGLGIYFSESDNQGRKGLWEDGKRLEWFSDEQIKKINNQ